MSHRTAPRERRYNSEPPHSTFHLAASRPSPAGVDSVGSQPPGPGCARQGGASIHHEASFETQPQRSPKLLAGAGAGRLDPGSNFMCPYGAAATKLLREDLHPLSHPGPSKPEPLRSPTPEPACAARPTRVPNALRASCPPHTKASPNKATQELRCRPVGVPQATARRKPRIQCDTAPRCRLQGRRPKHSTV